MDHLDCPDDATWSQRRVWFEAQFDVDARGGGYVLSEQALGLLIDLQATFCAGAWSAVVVLATAIIDAHLREAELPENFRGGLKAAFEGRQNSDELEWLRVRRNRLVHFAPEHGPAVTVDAQWSDRDELEQEARRAILLVAAALFANPWV